MPIETAALRIEPCSATRSRSWAMPGPSALPEGSKSIRIERCGMRIGLLRGAKELILASFLPYWNLTPMALEVRSKSRRLWRGPEHLTRRAALPQSGWPRSEVLAAHKTRIMGPFQRLVSACALLLAPLAAD